MTMHQAIGLQGVPTRRSGSLQPRVTPLRRAHCTAVVSGKGGVGKSCLVANLAVASAALGARVLVVDADMGLANLDVLLGMAPILNGADLLTGRAAFGEVVVRGPRGIHLLPAGSGVADLEALSAGGVPKLMRILEAESRSYDLMFLDAGAGIGPSVVELAAACPHVLLVQTPDPASLIDAYATCKILQARSPGIVLEVVENTSVSEMEARLSHRNLSQMTERFLGRTLPLRAVIPHDQHLIDAVRDQRTVVERFPGSASATRLVALAQSLLNEGHKTGRPR